ncbi:MAG TPA: RNA polymerase sigma factor [Bryobacteraceae bacterium]|jgi:RNA polymerase sigma-70 factor (ECF subfamily)|nr:RNA polymerase sigma factor [Bryobacteraceae bacterium]
MRRAALAESGPRVDTTVMDGAGRELDFDEIVETWRPRLFRYALALLRDADAAETITQDCFMRAWHALHTFRGDCSVQTWLMRIAVNLVRDHTRNRRLQFWKRAKSTGGRPLESYVAPGESQEKTAILKQQLAAIWENAGRLPNRQKTVFFLRFVEDMDILEIAAATGMKEGTVKAHLFRALQTLRRSLTI